MSDCQSSLCKMNGCMFPQACPNDRAPAADSRVCDTCGEQQNVAGYCTNKQCSRHGRRNDYFANDDAPDAPAARDDANDGIALAILAATKNVDALYEAAKTLQGRAIAAEARAVRCECVIRDAAHLMATRMEGTPIVESYGAAYRVLFGYLYPDAPLPNASKLEAW